MRGNNQKIFPHKLLGFECAEPKPPPQRDLRFGPAPDLHKKVNPDHANDHKSNNSEGGQCLQAPFFTKRVITVLAEPNILVDIVISSCRIARAISVAPWFSRWRIARAAAESNIAAATA